MAEIVEDKKKAKPFLDVKKFNGPEKGRFQLIFFQQN